MSISLTAFSFEFWEVFWWDWTEGLWPIKDFPGPCPIDLFCAIIAVGSILPDFIDLSWAYNFCITSEVLNPIFNSCLANFSFSFLVWFAWNLRCWSVDSPSGAVDLAKCGGTYPAGNTLLTLDEATDVLS